MADLVRSRITRRRFLLAVGASGLIVACGQTAPPANPNPTSSSGQAQPQTTQPVTLRLQARAGAEEDFFADRAEAFTKLNPNITVKPEFTPGGEYLQKLQTLFAGGQAGDVVHTFAGNASYQRFFVNGSLIALDQYVSQKKTNLNEWYKPCIDMCRVDGKLGALPFKGQPQRSALFYNSTLIESKGQKLPEDNWTLDNFIQMARGVSGGSGNDVTFGFNLFYNDLESYNMYAITFGAPACYSEDGKKALMNSEPVQNMIKWMYDMAITWKASPSPLATTPSPADLFNSGKVASYNSNWGGVAAIVKNSADKFKWNVVQFPAGPTGKRGNMVNADQQSVTVSSKNPGEAFDLVYFLCNKESGIKLPITAAAKGGSTTPGARPDVYESDELKNFTLFPQGFAEKQSKVMGATTTYFTLANYRGDEFVKAINDNLDLLLQDKEKPTTAFFDKLQSDCQAVLDLPRV